MDPPLHPSNTIYDRYPTNGMLRRAQVLDFDCAPSNVLRLERQVAALERDLDHSREAITEAQACIRSLTHLLTWDRTALRDCDTHRNDALLAEPPNIAPSHLSKTIKDDFDRSATYPNSRNHHDRGIQCQRDSNPGPVVPRFRQQNKSNDNVCKDLDLLGGGNIDNLTSCPTLDLQNTRLGHSISNKLRADQCTGADPSFSYLPPKYVRRFVSPLSIGEAADSLQSVGRLPETSTKHGKPRALPAPASADIDSKSSGSDSDSSFTYIREQCAQSPAKTAADRLPTTSGAMPAGTMERSPCFAGSECTLISV